MQKLIEGHLVRGLDLYLFPQRALRRLGEIAAPTAIVSGAADDIVLTDLHSRASARAIPGARLTILPGVGHSPHHAAPEAVTTAILDVARRADGASQPRSASAPR